MYEGTSTEQKAKNAKSGSDSMSKPLLQSLRQHSTLLPPFTQRRLDSVCLIYMACFSTFYLQSEGYGFPQPFCVSKKSNYKFRHAGRLLRNGAEFRILASGSCTMVLPPSKRRKTPKAAQTRCLSRFYNPSVNAYALPPPFTQERLKSVCLIYMACFSPFYRQSKP